ncbi:hypothetical protein KCP78_05830 [Salmonella enterica subsp. enterica]|nr:hypothetical protein KCP78_05830 [Salmonella enterica subsp. enterica]
MRLTAFTCRIFPSLRCRGKCCVTDVGAVLLRRCVVRRDFVRRGGMCFRRRSGRRTAGF